MDTFFGKFSKKAVLMCSIAIVLVFVIRYFNSKDNEIIDIEVNKAELPSQDVITKIHIGIMPDTEKFDDYEISDKEDIKTIMASLNHIYATGMKINQDDSYGGSGYHLELYVQDKQITNISLISTFLIIDEKEWEVSYEKAFDFGRVLAGSIYKQYQNDTSYDCLKGKVTELYNEDANIKDAEGFERLSRKRICIIDTDIKKIDISYSHIFNF